LLKQLKPAAEESADIALKFLTYLASDPEQLGRFMALTGISPQDLRQGIQDPAFQAGALDFALSDESLLLAFAANAGLKPEAVMKARSRLPGFSA